MAIRIEIESVSLETKRGISQKTGNAYEIREQKALMFKDGSRYPDKIKLTIQDGQSAYPVGAYTLSDDSYQVSRFNAIEVRPVLVAVPVAKAVSNG